MADRTRHDPKQLIVASLRAMVRGLEVETVSPADAVSLVDWFALVERLGAAGKALAAARVASSGTWQGSGERSAADWLAKRTGSTVGDARSALDTAAHLPDAPGTDAALRAGELSMKQAEAIASVAALDPAAEPQLLGLARQGSLQKLRDESARVRAAAEPDPAARHQRIHRNRFWRRWTDRDGARRGSYSMTPEASAVLEAAAQPFIDAMIDEARRAGVHEPSEAHAADGLVGMAASTMSSDDTGACDAPPPTDGPGGSPAPGGPVVPRPPRGGRGRRRLGERRELVGVVNLESLVRGSVAKGELCEIAGVGPVPLDVARSVFGDALLRIVIRDGVDIRTVVHTGRTASAVQETAVLVRDGGRCRRPTCGLPISEIDHVEGYPSTRTTTLDDLAGLCGHDHDLKSVYGHTYRFDGDGHVEWTRLDGVVEYERPPP